MWPDRVSNPGPLAPESNALLTALHGPAINHYMMESVLLSNIEQCYMKESDLTPVHGIFTI